MLADSSDDEAHELVFPDSCDDESEICLLPSDVDSSDVETSCTPPKRWTTSAATPAQKRHCTSDAWLRGALCTSGQALETAEATERYSADKLRQARAILELKGWSDSTIALPGIPNGKGME